MENATIQHHVKEIFTYIDLYGNDLLLTVLLNYPLVSHRKKSIPKAGSPTWETAKVGKPSITYVDRIIYHKNGYTTIETDKGFYQFFT